MRADSIGDARASVILSWVCSRTLCGAGDVTGHVELARDNLRAAEAMDAAVLCRDGAAARDHVGRMGAPLQASRLTRRLAG